MIRIGNSRGVILPASLLKEAKMPEAARFDVVIRDGQIILIPQREYAGPFTGPFAALDVPGRESLWGAPKEDALSVAESLRSETKRDVEDW